jgi:stage II sporulation protein AA (anti-sigma F factor antagonist)
MEDFFKVKGTSLTIFVPGELDHHNAEKIRTGADKIIERQNIRSVIFDFEKTNFMDSSGIGVIMGRYKNLRCMGGKVIAINVSERLQKILTLSGIYKIVEIYNGLPHQSNLV